MREPQKEGRSQKPAWTLKSLQNSSPWPGDPWIIPRDGESKGRLSVGAEKDFLGGFLLGAQWKSWTSLSFSSF